MKNTLLILLLFFLPSCKSYLGALKDGRYENNVALREMSYEIDELRDSLQQTHLEINALEDRLQGQESELMSLRNLNKSSGDFAELDKKIEHLARAQTNTHTEIQALSNHSTDTTSSFTSYRDKIKAIEKRLASQDRRLNEAVKLKGTLTSISKAMNQTSSSAKMQRYVVQYGDTLGKIANMHRTTVSKIKSLNNLDSNRIFAGQKLKLPQ